VFACEDIPCALVEVSLRWGAGRFGGERFGGGRGARPERGDRPPRERREERGDRPERPPRDDRPPREHRGDEPRGPPRPYTNGPRFGGGGGGRTGPAPSINDANVFPTLGGQ
jgi:hypothetical protein